MAHYLTNNEKFHIFSKSPVLSSMAVSQAVNKSGHTVSTNDVWADDVPWFTEVADEAGAITRAADARYNDLILWGSDIYVRKGDKTNGASTGTTFAELWEKHTDLTEARAYALGSVTTQTPTNIVTKTVELKNASDKVVLKYHVGKQIDLLTTANNANVASTWAARMFIDGKVVDQFVSPTDKVFAGNPSTGYTTLVYTATAAGNNYGFVAEGEADEDFVNNAFAGIVQFNQSRNDTHKFAASVFEYVGDKLDTALSSIDEKIQDIVGTTMEGVVASVGTTTAATNAGISVNSDTKTSPKIDISTGTVGGQSDAYLVTGSTVKTYVDNATLKADVSDEGVVTEGDEAKLVTATSAQYIATKAASDEITAATLTSGDNAIETATGDTATKLVTAEQVKEYVDENAKVTLTADTATGKTGITISPNAQESTSFTIGINQTVIATKQSVDDLSTVVSGVAQTVSDIQTSLSTGSVATAIQAAQDAADAAQDTADEAKGIAETAVQTVKVNGTALTKTDTEVDITAIVGVDETATNGINVTKTTDNKVKVSVTPATYTKKNGETPGSWGQTMTNFATAQSVSDAIADAVSAIVFPTLSTSSTGVGLSASGHTVDVATADYTASTDTWTNKSYLVTGTTVEAFVNDVVSEVSSDLTALENKVNAYHEAGVSYKIHDSQTLPDLSVVENVENYKNVILLVPSTAGGGDWQDKTAAITGGYVEWLCVNKGTKDAPSWDWEQIGTTEADLHDYVNTISVGQATDFANQDSVYASISSNGYLTLGVASATSDKMGVSKMFTGELSSTSSETDATDTAVSVKSAQAMYSTLATQISSKADANNVVTSINGIEGAVNLCVHNAPDGRHNSQGDGFDTEAVDTTTHANLWGMGFVAHNQGIEDNIILIDSFVGLSTAYLSTANLPSDAVSVENNFVYNSEGSVITTIRPERMVSGFRANSATGLKSFVGDLSNLENASWGNSPDSRTFYDSSAFETFIGDLSSLTDGSGMFYNCAKLTTCITDLSSLSNGEIMFSGCKLDAESLECIADTLPTVTGSHSIDIGYGCSAADAQAAYDVITGKGWTCEMTYHA